MVKQETSSREAVVSAVVGQVGPGLTAHPGCCQGRGDAQSLSQGTAFAHQFGEAVHIKTQTMS